MPTWVIVTIIFVVSVVIIILVVRSVRRSNRYGSSSSSSSSYDLGYMPIWTGGNDCDSGSSWGDSGDCGGGD